MTPDQAMDIVRQMLVVALLISSPILLAGLFIGLIISIFQAVTQIQEQTLSFVPKIMGMAVVAIAVAPWVYTKLAEFAHLMFAP